MPLYELEEGTSRKFYRVERDGTRVHLHWGRIGAEGSKKTLVFATDADAEAELERQILKRREHGYRRVLDESKPHDPEDARQARLQKKTGPLSATARFFFVHAKKKAFAWVEANGDALVVAEGPLGREAETAPRSEPCGSPAAAAKKRDRLVADLLAKGYALATFGAAEEKKKRPGRSGVKLHRDLALEAHVREDPDAEDRWAVLEDAILEHPDDPRAEIIRHEKAGERGDAAEARGRAQRLLLGPKGAAITKVLGGSDHRAGFVRECTFDATPRGGAELLAAFVESPAAALLDTLDLRLDAARAAELLACLAGAPLAAGLRDLTLVSNGAGGELDGAAFAPFTRLDRLFFYGNAPPLRWADGLAPLTRLGLMPSARADLALAFPKGAFPRLAELLVDARYLGWEGDGVDLDALAGVLRGDAAPALERLTIYWASATRAILDALARSALGPRLRVLSLGGPRVDPATLRPRYGPLFAPLETLELPAA